MKKLFLFTALLIAALFSANAFAYHVYVNDSCTQGKPNSTFWNSNRISKIGAVTLGSDVNNNKPMAAWFYDAKGDLFGPENPVTDKIEGLSIVESSPFHVDEMGSMFFSIDYYIITKESSNMRNFGIRIRLNSNNDWDTLFVVRPQGGTFPAYSGYGNTKEISIGDKYNGQNVVLQIFFYNDPFASDAFIMAFSNILLVGYDSIPNIRSQFASRPVAYGDTYAATLNCTNQSLASITSVEYAYSINRKTEKKQTVTIADTLKGKASAALSFDLDITEADIDTTNQIQIWPVAINGEAYVAEDTIDFLLAVVDEDRLDQDYVPMLECFTSATCPPCRQLNPYLNPVLAELKNAGKLNVVKYQVNWPYDGDRYYISGNTSRVNYYNVIDAPTLVLNGTEKPMKEWDWIGYSSLMNQLREKVDAISQGKAFFTIKMNKAEVKPDSTVELDFDVISHLPETQRVSVYAMIIEGTTHGNSTSTMEKDFHYVNMAFATPATGKIAYLHLEEQSNYTYTVKMKNTHMEELEDLQVVIFVQDPSDNYICQSLGVKMGKGEAAAVEDEQLAQVSLRPNPASEKVYVEGLEKARVEIFDLAGRKVYEMAEANDVLEVSLASFAKGVYVVRIAQNGAVASRKLVVK